MALCPGILVHYDNRVFTFELSEGDTSLDFKMHLRPKKNCAELCTLVTYIRKNEDTRIVEFIHENRIDAEGITAWILNTVIKEWYFRELEHSNNVIVEHTELKQSLKKKIGLSLLATWEL